MRPRWWIFLGALALCGVALLWAAASGPDPFPVHWGAGGAADSFEPRGKAVAILAVSSVGVAALIGVLAACAPAIPDRMINLPPSSRAYWLAPEHRPALDALLQRSLLSIGTGVLLLMAISVTGAVVRPDGNPVLRVGMWVLFAVIAVSVIDLVRRLLRPPTDTLKR
ncbi:hypothetical protein AXK56_04010 [Tsukamurella pulmonis]|uniref:DUF1648 domain-containing protein n=1 Tax=Tsukamurella pulmonis TaxID=47312 RepID=A0A1H1DP59_9ACTN|nr:hypothetical protein [Tsukamurella pulmonis]KXO92251.1 hypothetical protein AXK56_04010 [Tsukamurella pulmonis]SDQ78331.1 hypothetical protein SAMN04489765_1826 [Tsukamurella pulmonis]SUP21841.1 Predicted membrane protein [Tsukamurella pulmonis]